MIKVARTAQTIESQGRKLGFDVDIAVASTGTIYLAFSKGEVRVKVRVADHGECYCREDISVDPQGSEAWQAVKLLAESANLATPSYVKTVLTRKANAQIRKAQAMAEFEAQRVMESDEMAANLDAFLASQPLEVREVYRNLELKVAFAQTHLSGKARKSALKKARQSMKRIAGELVVYA